jgi:3-phosphoshikimate 1-carboxyvinyltransferase
LLSFVPASKSETLRALALSAVCGVPGEIHGAAKNEDTEIFTAAIESLGVSVDRDGDVLRLFPPKDLVTPEKPIFMGEGATGLRILGALSVLMKGAPLRLSGAPQLQSRPSEELRAGLGAAAEGWPLEIPAGGPLPSRISVERSSQFATGFLLAAAGALYRGKIEEYELHLDGEMRSMPYIDLTLALLREAGIDCAQEGRVLRLKLSEKKSRLVFRVDRDASSLAFLEVFAKRWSLASFFAHSRQGYSAFPDYLRRLEKGEALSLKDHPDLAPPLWAAAALLRLKLEVKDCPQLHWKESDRAHLLAEAAKALGAPAEEKEDGLVADFRGWVPPEKEIFLRTDGDHRMAMAFGLLATDYPLVSPDRRDCVRKSFPQFWHCLSLLEEVLP